MPTAVSPHPHSFSSGARYEDILADVQRATGLTSSAEAVATLRAVLETIADLGFRDRAASLAAHLPRELRAYLIGPLPDNPLDGRPAAFCRRLAARLNISAELATPCARAVVEALTANTPPSLVSSQFPEGFDVLHSASHARSLDESRSFHPVALSENVGGGELSLCRAPRRGRTA